MAQLKLSEEETIRLGNKLVKELNTDPRSDTLSKWIAHYIAELMNDRKDEPESQRTKRRKECLNVILELWKSREVADSLSKPLNGIESLVEMLNILSKDRFSIPRWDIYRNLEPTHPMSQFLEKMKNKSESILSLCLISVVGEELLKRKIEWIEDHESALTQEELTVLRTLEVLVKHKNSIMADSKTSLKSKPKELTESQMYEVVFNKIEKDLRDVNEELSRVKEKILTSD